MFAFPSFLVDWWVGGWVGGWVDASGSPLPSQSPSSPSAFLFSCPPPPPPPPPPLPLSLPMVCIRFWVSSTTFLFLRTLLLYLFTRSALVFFGGGGLCVGRLCFWLAFPSLSFPFRSSLPSSFFPSPTYPPCLSMVEVGGWVGCGLFYTTYKSKSVVWNRAHRFYVGVGGRRVGG